jgi:dTDP-4-dehydrorhamnose reductase
MRILLTGRNGQVGWELERSLGALGELLALDRGALDLSRPDSIRRCVREARPGIIVNAAAYTAVDQAESEPQIAEVVNAQAPGVLAEEAKRAGALLVHYSTDYVFDGTGRSAYVESDVPNPINVYGATKLGGEQAVRASGCVHYILRTSWVYSARGRNFLLTMLKHAQEKQELRVVSDQVGAPTWSRTIAQATVSLLGRHDPAAAGLYHLCSSGSASWYEFACAIVAKTAARRSAQPAMVPITSREFPTRARRPSNSRLDNSRLSALLGWELPDWRDSLSACLQELPAAARAD